MTSAGIVRIAREVLLTFGALLGAACLLLAAASMVLDVRPLVFRSGSMSPAIGTGDLAIARTVDAADVRDGDIVSVVTSTGTRVTHRVVGVEAQGSARRLTLKGDANARPDAEMPTVDRVDRVLFHVPRAGGVVDAVSSPVGLFVLGLYVAGMAALVLRRGGEPPAPPDPPTRRAGGARRAARTGRNRAVGRTVAVSATALTLATVGPAGAATPWADSTTVSAAFTTGVVAAPVSSCGALSVGSVRLNWTAVSGATGYLLRYGTNGTTSEQVGPGVTQKTISGVATSGVFSVQAQVSYGSTTWSSVASGSRSYTVLLTTVSLCS
jgi:signal peptidase I